MLHIHKPTDDARSARTHESRLVYDWFAGWRWEQYREGELVDESLENFATREECVADARRHRLGQRSAPGAASAGARVNAREHELTELAA